MGGEIAPLLHDDRNTWRRTFPDSEPGSDAVAEVEGRTIGRVYRMDFLPREPKPWFWGVSDPTLTGRPGATPPLSGETAGPREGMRLVEQHWRRVKEAVGAEAYRAKKG